MKNVSYRFAVLCGCCCQFYLFVPFIHTTNGINSMFSTLHTTINRVCVFDMHETNRFFPTCVRLRESECERENDDDDENDGSETTTTSTSQPPYLNHCRQKHFIHCATLTQLSVVKILLVLQPLRSFQLFLFRNTQIVTQ